VTPLPYSVPLFKPGVLAKLVSRHALWLSLVVLGGIAAKAQPAGLEDDRFVRKRVEGLPQAEKLRTPLPSPDTQLPTDTSTYQPANLDTRTGIELPDAQAAPLPRPVWDRLYSNYLKAGVGRYLTPLVEAAVVKGRGGRNPDLGWGVYYRHLSTATGQVAGANFGENTGAAHLAYYTDDQVLYASTQFQHRVHEFYGDPQLANLERNDFPDSVRQRLAQFDLRAGIRSQYQPDAVQYDAGFRVQQFSDRFDNSQFTGELFGTGALPLTGLLEGLSGAADVRLLYTNRQVNSGAEIGQFFVDLKPYLRYQPGNFSAEAGFRLAVFSPDEGESTTGVYPYLRLAYPLGADSSFIPFLQLDGQTTYQLRNDLTAQNPYLAPEALAQNANLRLRLQLGVTGHVGPVSYHARFEHRSLDNQVVFFAPPQDSLIAFQPGAESPGLVAAAPGYFQAQYVQDFTATGVVAGLTYLREDRLEAGFELAAFGYATPGLSRYFHEPNLRAQAWASYRFADKLWVRPSLSVLGGRTLTEGRESSNLGLLEESAFVDVSLFAEYFFSRRISVWAEANNLLNQDYFRWYGYLERPLDVKLGGSLRF